MQSQSLFLWFLVLVGLSYAQRPELVLELSATNVTVGDQLNVSCSGQSITASRTVYIDGQSIVERISADRWSFFVNQTTTTWIIDPVQPEDAGEYFCFAGGDQGTHTDSLPQNVTVYVPPRPVLVLQLSVTNITVGEQLAASCTAQTITAIRVLYINGESAAQHISADRLSSNSSGMTTTWIIDPIQLEDAGEYYCFAGGDQGTHMDSPLQNVTVYISPDATNLTSPEPTEMEPTGMEPTGMEPTEMEPTGMDDGGQAFAYHQLVGSGIAVALFILLLIILLSSLLVYLFKRRSP